MNKPITIIKNYMLFKPSEDENFYLGLMIYGNNNYYRKSDSPTWYKEGLAGDIIPVEYSSGLECKYQKNISHA